MNRVNLKRTLKRLGGVRPVVGNELRPMDRPEIAAIEEQIGTKLPDAYQTFLMTCGACAFNGESPDRPYVVFRSLTQLPPHISDDDEGLIDAFYGGEADKNDPYSLRVRLRFFAGRMPESLIPIGDDGGAGQVCLGVRGNETGKVFYWDQANEPLDEDDYEEDSGEPRPPEVMFQNVYQIAESFEDFLDRLQMMKTDA